jgi:Golgi nucleoside diphosphatase
MKIIIDSYNAGYEDAKCNHINDALNFAQLYLYSKGIEHYPVLISDIRGMKITSLEWLGHKMDKYGRGYEIVAEYEAESCQVTPNYIRATTV